jgi:hypothetical protein
MLSEKAVTHPMCLHIWDAARDGYARCGEHNPQSCISEIAAKIVRPDALCPKCISYEKPDKRKSASA